MAGPPGSLVVVVVVAVAAVSTRARSFRVTRRGSGSSQGRRGFGSAPLRFSPHRPTIALRSASVVVATWQSRGSPSSAEMRQRPGTAAGSAAAASVPSTAWLSARLFTRRETLRLQFASRASRTTPLGRCVQRIRCTPSERPRAAMSRKSACSSGKAVSMVANSSTTITRRGSGFDREPALFSSVMSRAPAARMARSRCRSSAARLARARAACRPSRSVMRPTQWGRATRGRNAAPPLKSISRKVTASCGWAAAIAATQVTRSSLLPLPVVPPTTACGPAATRSSVTLPCSPMPITPARPGGRDDPAAVPGDRGRTAAGSASASSARVTEAGTGPYRPISPAVRALSPSRTAKPAAWSRVTSSGRKRSPAGCTGDRTISARVGPCARTMVSQPVGSSSRQRPSAMSGRDPVGTPAGVSLSQTVISRSGDRAAACGRDVAQAQWPGGSAARPTGPGGRTAAACTSSPLAIARPRAGAATMPTPSCRSAVIGAPVRVAASARIPGSSSGSAPSNRSPLVTSPLPRLTSTGAAGLALQCTVPPGSWRMPAADGVRPQAARTRAVLRCSTFARSAARAARWVSSARIRVRRRVRRPSTMLPTAMTGPRTAKRSTKAEPVNIQIATATTTGAALAISGNPGEGGSTGRAGRINGSSGRNTGQGDHGSARAGTPGGHPGSTPGRPRWGGKLVHHEELVGDLDP